MRHVIKARNLARVARACRVEHAIILVEISLITLLISSIRPTGPLNVCV